MKPLRAVASFGMFFVLATAAANAQASPAPAPSATPPVTPASVPDVKPPLQAHEGGGMMNGHLPIIDLAPESTWANPGSTVGYKNGGLPGVVSGSFNLSGSFTIPIVGGLTASYDRIAGNFLNSTFARTAVSGVGYNEPGSLKRHMDQERLDYAFGKSGLAVEVGLQHNTFECCPSAAQNGLVFHDGYAAVTYTTPKIAALNGLNFSYTAKGLTAAHRPSNDEIAGAHGLDIGNKREYGLAQVLTATLPIDKKLFVTGTYFNGAYDFFTNGPFPYRFNLFNETANFGFAPNVTFQVGATNAWQMEQGAPFPAPGNAIHFVSYYTALKLHLDFNKLTAR